MRNKRKGTSIFDYVVHFVNRIDLHDREENPPRLIIAATSHDIFTDREKNRRLNFERKIVPTSRLDFLHTEAFPPNGPVFTNTIKIFDSWAHYLYTL